MAGSDLKWLERLKMDVNTGNWWKMLDMAGNGWAG